MKSVQRKSYVLLVALALSSAGLAQNTKWIATWAASQQSPEPQNALPLEDMRDMTLRQIFRLSIAGSSLRVHVSNAFGTEPLRFTSVHIGRPLSPSSSQIVPGTDRALTFAGRSSVLVAAGAEYISDPIDFAVAPLSSLAVTLHLDSPPVGETAHPGSRATSYYLHGDLVGVADLLGARQVDHWYQVSAIDVRGPNIAAAVVVLGDSITDGHGATTNGNDRWTDVLAERLQADAAQRNISVLNEGIGGNHLLTDGLGQNALGRFDRDVLAPAAVRYVIVLEGVNDLGGLTRLGEATPAAHADLVHRITSAYEQMIERAHAHGLQIFGATILPFGGSNYYHPPASTEADRQSVNDWIRAPGHFDGLIDFDKVMHDPQHPDRLLPAYDCGDHLHPNPSGYRAMGEAVPLSLFASTQKP